MPQKAEHKDSEKQENNASQHKTSDEQKQESVQQQNKQAEDIRAIKGNGQG